MAVLFPCYVTAQTNDASYYVSVQSGLYFYDVPESGIYANAPIRIAGGRIWDIHQRATLGVEVGATFLEDKGRHFDLFCTEYGYYRGKRMSADVMSRLESRLFWKLNVFATLGLAYTKTTFEEKRQSGCRLFWESVPTLTTTYNSGSYHHLSPKGGLGLSADLTPHINFNLSVNHEFFSDSNLSVLLGLRYRF